MIWIILLALLPIGFASSYRGLYPTEAMRQAFTDETNASSEVALLGRVTSSSLGGLTAWRWSTALAILLGVFGLVTLIRHTRLEEESGRREMVESAVIGRYASLSAEFIKFEEKCTLPSFNQKLCYFYMMFINRKTFLPLTDIHRNMVISMIFKSYLTFKSPLLKKLSV